MLVKDDTSGKKPKSGSPVNTGSHFKGEPDKDKMGKRRRRTNSIYLKKRSTTDPDATLFYRPGAGSHLSYKAHFVTDTNGIITAVAASPSSLHDTGAVPVLIDSHEKIMGTPAWVAADTKYGSEECLRYLQDRGIKTSINPETKSNRPGYFSKDEFIYDKNRDHYTCPQGNILKRKAKNYKLNRITYRAKTRDCQSCPVREKCIDSIGNNPRIITHYDSQCYQKAKEWYHSNYGRAMQKLRGTVIEGVFGQAKVYHGMARSKFRGLEKVEIQFLMTATALNLKKIVRILDIDKLTSRFSREISYIIQTGRNILRNLIVELVFHPS